MTDSLPIQSPSQRGAWGAAVLIAAAFFVATAPTLAWLEFASTMENLVVAAALECRRDHHWLVPTLENRPRLAKPPLATWIAAGAIRPSTLRAIASEDFRVRSAGYRALAWDVRWPALLASCLMLLAVFDLGKTIGGAATGLISMTVCGSSLFFLRFSRQMTTDVQLALWVAVASCALARLALRGRSWGATFVAGAALGLAMMSKGPVAMLQTVVPVVLFLLWRGRARRRISVAQIVGGAIVMLVIGGTWYFVVAVRDGGAWTRWWLELSRSDTEARSSNPLSYAKLLVWMLPWTAVLIHGLIWTIVEAWRARRHQAMLPNDAAGMVLAMFLLVVPVVVMSFSHDRQDRYLLPMAGAASVISARGILAMLDRQYRTRVPAWVQWAIVFIIAVGLPIAGATVLKRPDGRTWYPIGFAAVVIALLMLVIVIAHQMSLRRPAALVMGCAAVMLLIQPVFYLGYRQTPEGQADLRPLAETIRTVAPDAQMYNWRPDGPKRADVALSIYMNRPTVWIDNPSRLGPSAGARSQVMIAQQRARHPLEPPAGWLPLASMPKGNDVFCAFIRPGEQDAPNAGDPKAPVER